MMSVHPHPARLSWARNFVRLPDDALPPGCLDLFDAAATVLGDSPEPDDRIAARYLRRRMGAEAVADVNADALDQINDAADAAVRAEQAANRWWIAVMVLGFVAAVAGASLAAAIVQSAVNAGRM